MNNEFDVLVDLFKNLSTEEKQKALIDEFKINVAAFQKLNMDIDNSCEMLLNREISDVNKEEATLDDYLEAYFVYLHMINHFVSNFAETISKRFYEE